MNNQIEITYYSLLLEKIQQRYISYYPYIYPTLDSSREDILYRLVNLMREIHRDDGGYLHHIHAHYHDKDLERLLQIHQLTQTLFTEFTNISPLRLITFKFKPQSGVITLILENNLKSSHLPTITMPLMID